MFTNGFSAGPKRSSGLLEKRVPDHCQFGIAFKLVFDDCFR